MAKQSEYIDFEEEYLLLQRILQCLKDAGVGMSNVYRQDTKKVAIHNFQIGSSHLTLTSLAGVINFGFDKFQPENENPFWRNKLELAVDEVESLNPKYSIEKIGNAVDTLEFNGDVITEIQQKDNFPQNKIVTLAKEGFSALAANKYLKKAKEEKYAKDYHASTLRTNIFAIGSGVGAVIFAALAFTISALQYCNQPESISPADLQELKTELSKIADQKKATDTVWLKNLTIHPNSKTSDGKTNDSVTTH